MTTFAPYADIALEIPNIPTYQYEIPSTLAENVRPGALVRVPVGSSTRTGVVVRLTSRKKATKLKPIIRRIMPDFLIPEELIKLAEWISDYYICGIGETLATVSYIGFHDVKAKTIRRYQLRDPDEARRWLEGETTAPIRMTDRQRAVIQYLLQQNTSMTEAGLINAVTGAGSSVLKNLKDRGVLITVEDETYRDDHYPDAEVFDQPHILVPAQADAYNRIADSLNFKNYRAFLLHGITGSGKTEIYLRSIARVLDNGQQAIVLVPEIALTPQTVERFRARFGKRVGVYHSGLNLGQKYDLYRKIAQSRIDIVIGARSAVFTPFPNLGLIVIDEEPETSYKQDTAPRYHARDVALMRARRLGATVIMGSATPSLESYYNALEGKATLLELPDRLAGAALPSVRVIDMREEVEKNKNPGLFSLELMQAIRHRMDAGEQSILFLNRRGYYPIVMCRECSQLIFCEQCDVLMTLHKRSGMLTCHLCGSRQPIPKECPNCKSANLHTIGMGTERIEDEIGDAFPDARCMRIDLDTTSSKFAYINKWREINRGNVDIILGTQMIAKGLDLPKVTLVGVVSADVALFQPDFRSAERAFSLLTQVAGRAGRRDTPGEVIVQTYCPQHYAIRHAQTHDYAAFFQKELHVRRILRFPPHYRLIALVVSGSDPDKTRKMSHSLSFCIRRSIKSGVDDETIALLGPAPAPIAMIKKRFRWRMLLRGSHTRLMREIVRRGIDDFHRQNKQSHVQIRVDVDPQDML